MVARSGHSGSTASRCPCCASVLCNSAMVQPASTVTVRSAQACSRTRFRWRVESITSARRGGLPQSSFVPPPVGITAWPLSLAFLRTDATSPFVRGLDESRAKLFSNPQNRSATPATSSGCGTYSPGFSPHRRVRGNTLVGFDSCKGSKAQRTRCMVSRSGSANIFDIMCFFSSPTPCSPVIEPPFSMHSSRMRSDNRSAAFS